MKNVNILSMTIMVIGLLMYVVLREMYAVWVYGAGAVGFAIARIIAVIRFRSSGKHLSRLPQIRLFSAVALLGAAYLMYDGSNSWSVLLLVSAVVELYASFRES